MVTDINLGTRAGYRYNVSGSISRASNDNITGDGTTTAPVIIRGYASSITDGWQGYSSDGRLNTSNFASITYTGGNGLLTANSDYLQLECLNLTTSRNGASVTMSSSGSRVIRCKIENSGTGASGLCAGPLFAFESWFIMSGASGGLYAINLGTGGKIYGCRVKVTQAIPAISIGSACTVTKCVIEGSGGVGIAQTTGGTGALISDNTIYDCDGDGVDINSSVTGMVMIVNNTITDVGGYAIDSNASTVTGLFSYNRTRVHTLGQYNGSADWHSAGDQGDVTTGGAASTDYVDAANGDLMPVATSPMINSGVLKYNNIGALGRDQSVSSGSTQTAYAFAE